MAVLDIYSWGSYCPYVQHYTIIGNKELIKLFPLLKRSYYFLEKQFEAKKLFDLKIKGLLKADGAHT